MNRWLTGIAPLGLLSALLVASLFMLSAATQNSALFGRVYLPLLVFNVLGVAALILLIGLSLARLVRQYRARVLGSRLTLRLLLMFTALSVLPVAVVFLFSIQTLNRGIDSWFDVRIEQALDDALALGRASLDAIQQDLIKGAHEMAGELETDSDETAITTLNDLREARGLAELTLYTQNGRIIAASSDVGVAVDSLLPDRPSDAILARIRQGETFAHLDAGARTGLHLRVVVPVYAREVGAPLRILQASQALPARYAKLGESVQTAYAEYDKLVYLRGPLKFSFTLTLALVALLTLLVALWAAIFSSRRLVAPLTDLAAGTRAVAGGDYSQRLPVQSHDELGILVQSFNRMTQRIHRAQSQIKRGGRAAEIQRTYLETVLNHLSSGVLSFDPQARLRTHNAAAGQILDVALETGRGRPLAWIGHSYPHLQPLVEAIERAHLAGTAEWQSEVVVWSGRLGRRTLILRGTSLPGLQGRGGGFVVVFDDVTALIQAQRAAAWGDVARRMAHEIKNPLTPIQLSADRIRHKYLPVVRPEERAVLERATHTIIEQVESLKSLVNAFADYARPAQIEQTPVRLNDLVRDVLELYRAEHGTESALWLRPAEHRAQARDVALTLDLDDTLPPIAADAGRLRQVLHNLLLNARDALIDAPAPAIHIATRAVVQGEQRFIELTLADNGPGFPDALLERLFEPYVTTKAKGTGLGLAIVKRIVEEHNGAIEAANRGRGGAEIHLRLPIPMVTAAVTASERRRAHGDKNA